MSEATSFVGSISGRCALEFRDHNLTDTERAALHARLERLGNGQQPLGRQEMLEALNRLESAIYPFRLAKLSLTLAKP